MQKQGMEGGIFAIKCIEPDPDEWLNTVPPLGTWNEDDVLTQEDSAAICIAATYKVSQALKGMFEQMYGKMAFSVNIDEDATDSKDITTGNDTAKGYQNIEGTFEFQMINDDSRWDGATLGNWDYLNRGYYRRKVFRPYEAWVLMTPDSKMVTTADAAERLWKFIGLKLGRVELEGGQPNSFRIPFKARRVFKFPNWVEPTPVTLLTAEPCAAGNISLTTPITSPDIFHTRLLFTFSTVTTAATLTIYGYNIYGERVKETVDLSAKSGSFTYLTKAYFSVVNASGVVLSGAWSLGTFAIDENDVGLA